MIRIIPGTSELNLTRDALIAHRGSGLQRRLENFTSNVLRTA
jgi:hypothetical protein